MESSNRKIEIESKKFVYLTILSIPTSVEAIFREEDKTDMAAFLLH